MRFFFIPFFLVVFLGLTSEFAFAAPLQAEDLYSSHNETQTVLIYGGGVFAFIFGWIAGLWT